MYKVKYYWREYAWDGSIIDIDSWGDCYDLNKSYCGYDTREDALSHIYKVIGNIDNVVYRKKLLSKRLVLLEVYEHNAQIF